MKKIFIIMFFILISYSNSFAYTPTNNEIKLLNIIKQKTYDNSIIKWQLWLKKEINSLQNKFSKVTDKRIQYLLSVIIDDKKSVLNDLIIKSEENKKYEAEYNIMGNDFFNQYWKEITTSLSVNEKCTKYFNFIDNLAKENNFPTELIIATWSKEFNCNLSNPDNWWWPFQITSKNYIPWEITLEQFKIEIIDFINFSKSKWNYFNTNIYVDYKSRFWEKNMDINYNNYSIRDLKLHSILYNGIKSDTTLDWNTFTNDNLNEKIISDSDWLITRFLKILKWRIEQKNDF